MKRTSFLLTRTVFTALLLLALTLPAFAGVTLGDSEWRSQPPPPPPPAPEGRLLNNEAPIDASLTDGVEESVRALLYIYFGI